MSIIIAFLLFSLLVLVHEFGHFLFAKLCGVGVVEFSIGMGPRLISFKKGGTRYSLKCFPFGGSCMMVGEDEKRPDDPKAFNNKPVLSRIAVIAAGPVFNFILAFLFAMVIVSQIGHDPAVIYDLVEGYPAEEAGLRAGDLITQLNRRRVVSCRDVTLYLYTHPGEELTVRYGRETEDGTENLMTVLTPLYSAESGSWLMGVYFSGYEDTQGIGELLYYSAYEVKFCIVSTLDSLRMMFRRQVKVEEAVTGPVGIVSMVGETVDEGAEAGGAYAVLLILSDWALLLSASLGIMNLLPIPALDGGRLLFLLIELVRGRPVDPEKEGMVHAAGMVLLMALMVMILFLDISRLL